MGKNRKKKQRERFDDKKLFSMKELTREEMAEHFKSEVNEDITELLELSQYEDDEYLESDTIEDLFNMPKLTQEEMAEYFAEEGNGIFCSLLQSEEDTTSEYDSNAQDVINFSKGKYSFEIPVNTTREEISKISNNLEQMEHLEQKKALEKLARNDEASPYEVAQRLLNKHRFIYLDPPYKNKTLSYFNGKYWAILNDDYFSSIIYGVMSEEEKKAEKKIKSFIGSVKEYIILECFNGYINKEKKYYFSKAEFEAIEYCTVFNNGIYDIRKGKFYTGRDASKRPYSFALDAEYYEKHDPRQRTCYMDKLLTDASRDEDTVNMAYELLGYLTVPCHNAKAFITLAGVGDSGKSVFGGFCETIFKDERSFRIQPHLLGKQFAYSCADVANLYTCLDMETRFLTVNEVAQIKQLAGEEYIRSEAKYKQEKTVPIRFKLLLATNGTIQCQPAHEDPALYRRLVVLPFLFKTNEKKMIAGLPKMLQDEKSAILSKAVRAVSKCVNENGMISFHVSEISLRVKASWSGTIDYDKDFLEEAFFITGNPEDIVCKQDVSELYVTYCERNTDKVKIRSQANALFSKIANLDSRIISGSNVKSRKNLKKDFPNPVACFKGIKWNQLFLSKYYGEQKDSLIVQVRLKK